MRSKIITLRGERDTFANFARRYGVNKQLVHNRIRRRGWTLEEAFGLIPHDNLKCRYIEINGRRMNIKDWAKEFGITRFEFCSRYKKFVNGECSFEDICSKKRLEKRRDVTFTFDGITDTVTGWAKRLGIPYYIIYSRLIKHKWSIEDTISKPIRQGTSLTIDGITDTYTGWAKRMNLGIKGGNIINYRLNKLGWTVREAVGLDPHESKQMDLIEHNGIRMSHVGWARHLGLNKGMMNQRIRKLKQGIIQAEDVFRRDVGHTENSRVRSLTTKRRNELKRMLTCMGIPA